MKKVSLLIIFLVFGSTSPAFAHQLLENQDSETNYHIIPDFLNSSWFILEESEPEQHKHFIIDGSKGDVVSSLQVIIPDIPTNPQPTDYIFRITDINDESFEVIYDPINETFFEPFSRTNWLVIYDEDFELPFDGEFKIHVVNNADRTGKFSLALGIEENFEIDDILIDFPITIIKMKLFFEDHLSLLLPIVFVLLLAYLFIQFRKRKT